jgi:DNA-binding HxlR family transcriptional regulator
VPPRVEYSLTDKGQALLPLIEDMRRYGREWLGACESEREPAIAAA